MSGPIRACVLSAVEISNPNPTTHPPLDTRTTTRRPKPRPTQQPVKSKRHRGSRNTHGTHTGHTGAHGHTDHTDEPHNHPNPTTHPPLDTRTTTRRPKPQPTQQPHEQRQAQSRQLPAADSEEAAPSEPDPASTRSQSASPRLLESGRRKEGAHGRCVTAGGAARAPDEPGPVLFR